MLHTLAQATRAITTRQSLLKVGRRAPVVSGWAQKHRPLSTSTSCRAEHTAAGANLTSDAQHAAPPLITSREEAKKLPLCCPGCGAPSQTVDSDAPGYYGSRRATKAPRATPARQREDEIFENALNLGILGDQGPAVPSSDEATKTVEKAPICDRCHFLLYQSRGQSIVHPSMQSIQQTIEQSPHKHNHIYHVLDAADFPMSLIPNLQHALRLPRMRTLNRRSKTVSYIRGRTAEVSFVITRSDLLAPKKEQVDSLLPYIREVLRDALRGAGKDVRLGNVRLVSTYRGWWTRTVKEDIWTRGGAGWMVGKVNVGKSALYEVVFPKGRNEVDTNINRMRNQQSQALASGAAALSRPEAAIDPTEKLDQNAPFKPFGDAADSLQESELAISDEEAAAMQEDVVLDEDEHASLLPPAQVETPYPHMPIVSALPGTTASPIRIPFGNGRGELIDLPGVYRSSLDNYVKPEHRKALMMKSRVVPEQHSIKPGQSLLIGGLVRITPKDHDLVVLAYPFVPLEPHVTSTDKAVAIQTGFHENGEPYSGTVESITTDSAKQDIRSAGTVRLQWDVTKARSGPLTHKAAGKMKAANLPFTIYSADILIEGVGWVELTCQVRNRRASSDDGKYAFGRGDASDAPVAVPEVEVFTPEGKFVGVRRPMNGWVLGGPKKEPKHLRRPRPRQSIHFARRKAGGATGQTTATAQVA